MPRHTAEPTEDQLNIAADITAQVASSPDAPITTAQLMQFLTAFATSQKQSESALATAIVEGMKEAAKPYVDPKKEENEELFRQQARRIEEQRKSNERASQQYCPHIAGCNGLSTSRDYQGRTCIIWHQLDSGETIGLCSNCQRVIRSTDPDYQKWRTMPSISHPSTGGIRDSYGRVVQLERELAIARQNQIQTPQA